MLFTLANTDLTKPTPCFMLLRNLQGHQATNGICACEMSARSLLHATKLNSIEHQHYLQPRWEIIGHAPCVNLALCAVGERWQQLDPAVLAGVSQEQVVAEAAVTQPPPPAVGLLHTPTPFLPIHSVPCHQQSPATHRSCLFI